MFPPLLTHLPGPPGVHWLVCVFRVSSCYRTESPSRSRWLDVGWGYLVTDFQGEETLAYPGEEDFSSMPRAAAFRRLSRRRWSLLVGNTSWGTLQDLCPLGFLLWREKSNISKCGTEDLDEGSKQRNRVIGSWANAISHGVSYTGDWLKKK